MDKQRVFIFIAILAILVGLGMVVYGNLRLSNPSNPNPDSQVANQNAAPSANLLIVTDQKASSMVTISEADLMRPGFVVVKDSNSPSGKTVGSSVLLSASKNISFFIIAQVSSGKTYYAYLYGDNGDGKFGVGDQILTDASGAQIVVPFRAN